MAQLKVTIALPDRALSRSVRDAVISANNTTVISSTFDLMTTFIEVEENSPHLVIIAEKFAQLAEFEAMRTLFSNLDVKWVVIESRDGSSWIQPKSSHLGDAADKILGATNNNAVPFFETIDQLVLAESFGKLPSSNTQVKYRGQEEKNLQSKKSANEVNFSRGRKTTSSQLILLGASTGGIDALLSILSKFTIDCPPTVIVQHTGESFGPSLSRLLDRNCQATVRLAKPNDIVSRGEVVVGAGISSHLVLTDCNPVKVDLRSGPPVSGHRPSVDVLFNSAVPCARNVVAALLTGMGRDGADGLAALRKAGARTIVQDQTTSVVYGMPRIAAEIGAAQSILPIYEIGDAVLNNLDKVS